MVQSYQLKQVLEPVEEFKNSINETQQNNSLSQYEQYLNNPIYDAVKSLELRKETTSFDIEKSQNIFLKPEVEYNTIQITGDEKIFTHVTIVIPSNLTTKIHLIEKNPNSYMEFSIILEKNSKLTIGRETYSTTYSSINSFSKENSQLDMIGAYSIKNQRSVLLTNSSLIEQKAYTNIESHGIAKEDSYVTNDTAVYIAKDAPNSIGHQHMKNIISHNTGKVSSKPILEIHNNRVECSHGATVSKLSPEIRYYGNAKGIEDEELTQLVSQGFFELVNLALNK